MSDFRARLTRIEAICPTVHADWPEAWPAFDLAAFSKLWNEVASNVSPEARVTLEANTAHWARTFGSVDR